MTDNLLHPKDAKELGKIIRDSIKDYFHRNTVLGRGLALHKQANEIRDQILAKLDQYVKLADVKDKLGSMSFLLDDEELV